MADTVSIPVKANYKLEDGQCVLQSAEYADVEASVIAEMILKAFRLEDKP